jgi:hypothetical protein
MALTVKIRGRKYAAASLQAASEIYEAKRDASGLGYSRFRMGEVYEGETLVAKISYNGRVWPPTEWVSGMLPIYDNRNAVAK